MRKDQLLWPATLLFALVAAFSFVACNDIIYGGNGETAASGDDTTAADDDTGSSGDCASAVTADPTWTNFGECFMTAYCTRCHSDPVQAGAPYPLVTLDNVVAHADTVRSEVASGGMPPSSPLPSDADKTMLAAWIDAGTPQ